MILSVISPNISTSDRIAILSLILQMTVTLIIIGTISYQVIARAVIPEDLNTIALVMLGFWFGRSTRTDMSGSTQRLEKYNE